MATQQSIKAYVDAVTTSLNAQDLDVSDGSSAIGIDLDTETLGILGGTGLASSASGNNVTLSVDAAQTGITSVTNASLVLGRDADNDIDFTTDNQITFRVSANDGVVFKASGEIEATSLDISGDADIDGTLEADAITVGGTALNTVIAGVTVTNATNAVNSTHVSVADNEVLEIVGISCANAGGAPITISIRLGDLVLINGVVDPTNGLTSSDLGSLLPMTLSKGLSLKFVVTSGTSGDFSAKVAYQYRSV